MVIVGRLKVTKGGVGVVAGVVTVGSAGEVDSSAADWAARRAGGDI